MTSPFKALISTFPDGSPHIDWREDMLSAKGAEFLVDLIRRTKSRNAPEIMLSLGHSKIIDLEAISILNTVDDLKGNPDFPYVFDFVDFGLESLNVEQARLLAQLPSCFLIFDHVRELGYEVARQFTGCGRSLCFPNCENLSPEVLSALVDPTGAAVLDIGLQGISIDQAQALSSHSGDLIINAAWLSAEVRLILSRVHICAPFNSYNIQAI